MSQDLVQNKLVEIKKAQELNKKLLPFLKSAMQENSIEFKATSKYSMQSAFAKMSFNNCHSKTKLFFQLLGKKKKRVVELTSIVFLRCVASSA